MAVESLPSFATANPARRVPAPVVVVAVVSVLAAATAVYLKWRVFPHGSANNDEGVYLLQAEALTQGRLSLPLPANPEAHQPWLFAIHDGRYVAKYLPVVAAVYALGVGPFGSAIPVLMALAAAVPVLAYLLARRLDLSAGRSAAAAVLLGLSPGVLVQTGLVLSYLPFLVLMLGCWLLVFRADDATAHRGRWALAAGFVGALAGCARPLDGLLMCGPAMVWLAWRQRGPAVVFGALPVAAAMAAYDAHVTGSPLRLPFALIDPSDKLGFGERRLFPEDFYLDFGLDQAVTGWWNHFWLEPARWYPGFVVLALLAVWAARPGGSARARHRLLLASSAATLTGYFFFWGPYQASTIWRGTDAFGPFYSLAPATPLVFAALTVPLGTRALAAALALTSVPSVLTAGDALAEVRHHERITDEILSTLQPGTTTLLDGDPPYLYFPVTGVGGDDVALAAHTPPSALPGTGPWRSLVIAGFPYRANARPPYELREQHLTQGREVVLRVERTGKPMAGQTFVVSYDGRTTACPGTAGVLVLTLTEAAVEGCSGESLPPLLPDVPYRTSPDRSALVINTFIPAPDGGQWATGWRRMPVEIVDGQLRLLTDGRALRTSEGGWLSVTPVRD
ncbi:MAG: hypothetical protein ACT4QG_13610 [Sporichthyaceae bacterium]